MEQIRAAILTKLVHFEAAHALPGHQGKCARLHGHSYRLEVSIRGLVKQAPGQSDDGMVMDFQDLSEIIQRSILSRLDHHYLNEIINERTTAENLVHWIWDALLQGGLPAHLLYRLRLWETETGYVEITRAEWGSAEHHEGQRATEHALYLRVWELPCNIDRPPSWPASYIEKPVNGCRPFFE